MFIVLEEMSLLQKKVPLQWYKQQFSAFSSIVYYIEALRTAVELADIPNKWLCCLEVDDKVGWINLMTYPIEIKYSEK